MDRQIDRLNIHDVVANPTPNVAGDGVRKRSMLGPRASGTSKERVALTVELS